MQFSFWVEILLVTIYIWFSQEPVAFMSGMFAGLLRLDLNDDPLKEWLTRTVEASGITEEEIDKGNSKVEEDAPQQIEIEWN